MRMLPLFGKRTRAVMMPSLLMVIPPVTDEHSHPAVRERCY